jgi:hypothetical protein
VAHADAQSRHHRVSHVYAALGAGRTLPKKRIGKFLLHRYLEKLALLVAHWLHEGPAGLG